MDNFCTTLDVDYLLELKFVKDELREREKELTHPLVQDLSLIPIMYEWYCEEIEKLAHKMSGHAKTMNRKIFVFIVVYLYSPVSIISRKIEKGIINSLAQVFNCYKYKKNINCLFSRILDVYPYNKEIRQEVKRFYSCIASRLKREGYI